MEENKTLFDLLSEAQAEMPNPKKSRDGQKGYQKYKYATLDAVLDIVKPPLNKRGIFLAQPCDRGVDGTMRIQTVVFYKGDRLVLDTKPYEYDSDPQEFGKRETYARRYSLLTAFGLAGEDDTDGDTGPKKQATEKSGKRSGEDDRKRYLARCLKLKVECIENGVKEASLDAWYEAKFGEADNSSMTLEQLTEWGQYLAQIAKDSKAMKEAKNEPKHSND